MVEGRSGTVLADWLADRDDDWKAPVATASLDPFRGYATALSIQLGAVALETSKQTPRFGGAVQMARASSVKLASSRRPGSVLKPSS